MSIDDPEPADVLCGRGKNSFRHRGNYFFRHLIVENAISYKNAPTKQEKGEVVMIVVRAIIARGGRFLVRNKEAGGKLWRDGGLKQGQKKAGHAFRDAARGRVRCVVRKMNARRAQIMAGATTRANEEARSTQSNDLTNLQANPRRVLTLPPTNSNMEPSRDWMTASMDEELADYLLSLFYHSKRTK